jgi:thioredoxin reductase (NADPH)
VGAGRGVPVPAVTEQLTEWLRATGQPAFAPIQIVGQQWAPRSHELRDLLDRNAIAYRFHAHDSPAGRQLLREVGQDGSRLPVLVLFDGRVLVDPSNQEGAAAIGIATRPEPGRYDCSAPWSNSSWPTGPSSWPS